MGPFSSVTPQDKTSEKLLDPAVGGLTVRNAGEAADLRSGVEDPSPSPVPATASPGDTADDGDGFPLFDDEPEPEPAQSSTPVVVALFDRLPDDLRHRITAGQKGKLLAQLARQLRDRTPDELAERLQRRWLWWTHTGKRVNDAYAVACTLVAAQLPDRRPCADLRCEDGENLDTGLPCMACADSRPLRSQPAEPLAPTVGENPTVAPVAPISSMSSSPAARTVAEALAPVPYVEPKTATPATRPPTASGGPNAAVAELRAKRASSGIQAPNRRPAADRVASPRVPDVQPDPATQAARDYLSNRGDNLDLMAAARVELGNEAPRDEVVILAAQLAGCP